HTRAEALQRGRQLPRRRDERAFGRRRQRRGQLAGAGKGVKQDRRRGDTPDQAWHWRAVGPAHPNTDGALAVEAHRPGVAVSVRRAGLEGDTAAGRVLWRRRAEKDLADVPGGDRIQQPACRRRFLAARRALRERHRGAEPRQPGIERNEVVERHPDAAEADGEPWYFARGQHERSTRLLEPRGKAAGAYFG